MTLRGMTAQQFLDTVPAAVQHIADTLGPDVLLVKNQVGNLAIMKDGEYHGYVDLMFGEVDIFTGFTGEDAD